jgi:VWFA-related protein
MKFAMIRQFRMPGGALCRLTGILAFAALLGAALSPAQQPTNPAPNPPVPAQQPANSQPPANAQQPAQNPSDQAQDTGPVFRIGANEVNLIFTVTDKHGKYVPNLKLPDFALLDDQKAPSQVTSFHQQINLPLRVGVLIDTSSSIRQRFQFEQQSAVEFLLQIMRPKSDRGFVMGFDVAPNVTADWTSDIDRLETGINKLRPGGGTALFDAVYTGCRQKLLDVTRGPEAVRKAIVLISDGDDDQSRVHLDEAIKECQRAETIIYAISTNWTPSRGKGDKVLADMAEATGGQVFFPPTVEEMTTSFRDIEQELRSQYSLTYVPADFQPNGAFRSIYLYCNDRRYQVRTRKGYFARKD